jgi:hypothetical protein
MKHCCACSKPFDTPGIRCGRCRSGGSCSERQSRKIDSREVVEAREILWAACNSLFMSGEALR